MRGQKMHLLWLVPLLFRISGSSAVTGPGAVQGWERGSLTVQCHYDQGYETNKKWWCRGAAWGSCKILVRTTDSEQEVKRGRVSIRDHHRNRTITVTMEALTRGDADTYWCGVERTGADLGDQVKVTVDPATTVSTTTTTTTTTTPTPTAPVTPEEGKFSPTLSHRRDFITKILLPLVAAVLLLVLTGASLLAWRLVRRQSKASGISSGQAPESELCYANLALHQTGTAGREASDQVEVEVEYIIGPSQNEDVAYAALSLGALGQEPTYGNTEPTYGNTEPTYGNTEPTYGNTELTYGNMEQLVTHIPHRSQEEPVEYSTVRRL